MKTSYIFAYGILSSLTLSSCGSKDQTQELAPELSEEAVFSIFFEPETDLANSDTPCYYMGGLIYIEPSATTGEDSNFGVTIYQRATFSSGFEGLEESDSFSLIQGTFNNQGFVSLPPINLGDWGGSGAGSALTLEFEIEPVATSTNTSTIVYTGFSGNLLLGGSWEGSFGQGNPECKGTWFLDFDSKTIPE